MAGFFLLSLRALNQTDSKKLPNAKMELFTIEAETAYEKKRPSNHTKKNLSKR